MMMSATPLLLGFGISLIMAVVFAMMKVVPLEGSSKESQRFAGMVSLVFLGLAIGFLVSGAYVPLIRVLKIG